MSSVGSCRAVKEASITNELAGDVGIARACSNVAMAWARCACSVFRHGSFGRPRRSSQVSIRRKIVYKRDAKLFDLHLKHARRPFAGFDVRKTCCLSVIIASVVATFP